MIEFAPRLAFALLVAGTGCSLILAENGDAGGPTDDGGGAWEPWVSYPIPAALRDDTVELLRSCTITTSVGGVLEGGCNATFVSDVATVVGQQIAYIVADNLRISPDAVISVRGSLPLLILANDIVIEGILDGGSSENSSGPGVDSVTGCEVLAVERSGGGGGGGGSVRGGTGGAGTLIEGDSGSASWVPTIPRAGCPGAGLDTNAPGGGGIHLLAHVSLVISNGAVEVNGAGGSAGAATVAANGGGGGGSGGLIVLDSPSVTVMGPGILVSANGGGGGGGGGSSDPGSPGIDGTRDRGGPGGAGAAGEGDGGTGGDRDTSAMTGGDSLAGGGGGGGGAPGIILINAATTSVEGSSTSPVARTPDQLENRSVGRSRGSRWRP